MNNPQQLLLDLNLPEHQDFDDFVVGPNAEAVRAVENWSQGKGEAYISLWGNKASGKSHLLEAACKTAQNQGHQVFYLSLQPSFRPDPEILQALAEVQLLAIDDLDYVQQLPDWQPQLYHLFNQIKANQHRLLVASREPLKGLNLLLMDLQSRLNWGPAYELKALQDEDKILILQRMSARQGMQIKVQIWQYCLKHYSRDLQELIHLYSKLVKESLTLKTPITRNSVKNLINR